MRGTALKFETTQGNFVTLMEFFYESHGSFIERVFDKTNIAWFHPHFANIDLRVKL